MINKEKYVQLSLELHLFWGRIMKEHAIFLQAGFTGKDIKLYKEAERYKISFEKLLFETVRLSNGNISREIIESGELFTEYTLESERKTKYYTGIDINSKITLIEENINCRTNRNNKNNSKRIVSEVKGLNCKALKILDGFINFKTKIMEDVNSCKIITMNYSTFNEHIIEEGKMYHKHIKDIENNIDIEDVDIKKEGLFWDEIMMEHCLFIRGLLDPSEEKLICYADNFAEKFEELKERLKNVNESTSYAVTKDTIVKTDKLVAFKKSAAKGLLNCEIKSIILPLLADHVIREGNHYLRLLEKC